MSKYELYCAPDAPIGQETWTWNMYGAGVENIGRDGRPERFPVPEPGDDQLLAMLQNFADEFAGVQHAHFRAARNFNDQIFAVLARALRPFAVAGMFGALVGLIVETDQRIDIAARFQNHAAAATAIAAIGTAVRDIFLAAEG